MSYRGLTLSSDPYKYVIVLLIIPSTLLALLTAHLHFENISCQPKSKLLSLSLVFLGSSHVVLATIILSHNMHNFTLFNVKFHLPFLSPQDHVV